MKNKKFMNKAIHNKDHEKYIKTLTNDTNFELGSLRDDKILFNAYYNKAEAGNLFDDHLSFTRSFFNEHLHNINYRHYMTKAMDKMADTTRQIIFRHIGDMNVPYGKGNPKPMQKLEKKLDKQFSNVFHYAKEKGFCTYDPKQIDKLRHKTWNMYQHNKQSYNLYREHSHKSEHQLGVMHDKILPFFQKDMNATSDTYNAHSYIKEMGKQKKYNQFFTKQLTAHLPKPSNYSLKKHQPASAQTKAKTKQINKKHYQRKTPHRTTGHKQDFTI